MNPYIFDFAYLSPSGRWGKILIWSTDFLLYFLAPFCLLYIQLRFSDYQSFWYSSWHFICLWADLYLLILFFNEAHNSSRKKQNSDDSKDVAAFLKFFKYIGKLLKDIYKLGKEDSKIFSVITLVFFIGIANFLIVGMLQCNTTIKWLNEFIAPKITIPPGTKIQKQSLEELKLIAIQIDTSKTKAWRSHGENYNLSGRQLVFSDFSDSYMQKIILKNASLQGSNMQKAQMQGADIWEAKLQGANMEEAKFQGADMKKAKLQGANMKKVELQGADMRGAKLQGANMGGAKLQGSDMRGAKLQGANMDSAKLQGANIWMAKFSGADMDKANLRGSFCKDKKYDGFFDQMNARIKKKGLEWCDTMDDSQFGMLNKGTAHRNRNVSDEKAPSMVEVEKGRLKLKEACDIIEGWSKSLEYAPGLKKTFADWINTKAGKKSRLKECSIAI